MSYMNPGVSASSVVEIRQPSGRCHPRRKTADLTAAVQHKIVKGGSYLYTPNRRCYGPAARHTQPVDTSVSHIGFGKGPA